MSQRYTYAFDEPPAVPAHELNDLLGGKGANLAVMVNELGLPVPPGFTISTAACREYLSGAWPAGLDDELRQQVERLGVRTGRHFGDLADPLLVSVRSGAPVSMPGMMDTILNVGLNEACAAGLGRVSGDQGFAADCLRRLREGYTSVIGAAEVPSDPWQQLRAAIEAVFRSWNSDRARSYRQREQIPDLLGTAVTVQAMVFGNRGTDSGTGVLFTRNPSTGEPTLYGDVMFNAQGEEVVAGGQAPQPISVLDDRLPAVAAELRRHADALERHYADLCDIEFTIENGRLWLLQVRVGKRSPRAALRMAIDMANEPTFRLSREDAVRRVANLLADAPRVFTASGDAPRPIATGLPASPGVATGVVATTLDAVESFAGDGCDVILVRLETSVEDVGAMARAAGVLTARGGLASHAAVVARGWGIPAVVGASSVRPGDDLVDIDGRTLAVGEEITIDGSTGEVYVGRLAGEWEVAPEAATLISWAAQLGIAITPVKSDKGSAQAVGAEEEKSVPSDDVLRALAIKGAAEPDQLAIALQAASDHVQAALDSLTGGGLAELTGAGTKLTAEGKLKATELFAADRASIGEERSVEILEQFHPLDLRMKEIVTAWQLRQVVGEQVINDHTDAGYDAQILHVLAALHDETARWLAPLSEQLHRYGGYSARLASAIDLAREGDQRYVASPRVDSYHSVWFELHEDLIRLAGRRRSEEAG